MERKESSKSPLSNEPIRWVESGSAPITDPIQKFGRIHRHGADNDSVEFAFDPQPDDDDVLNTLTDKMETYRQTKCRLIVRSMLDSEARKRRLQKSLLSMLLITAVIWGLSSIPIDSALVHISAVVSKTLMVLGTILILLFLIKEVRFGRSLYRKLVEANLPHDTASKKEVLETYKNTDL